MRIPKLLIFCNILALIFSSIVLLKERTYISASASFSFLATLIASIINNKNKKVKSSDYKFFNQFQEELPTNGSINFINNNNMAGFPFEISKLNDLYNYMSKWGNAEYTFINKKIENRKNKLYGMIDKYLTMISEKTFPTRMDGWNSVPQEWEDEQPERFWSTVNELHSLANDIYVSHQELIKQAKKYFD